MLSYAYFFSTSEPEYGYKHYAYALPYAYLLGFRKFSTHQAIPKKKVTYQKN